MIEVSDLRKEYESGGESITALDGVSFDIDAGSIVGVLGPNGAGKTTLIKSMLGIVIPTAGSIEIDGIDVSASGKQANERVGAVLEGARNTYWRLTVRENLKFFTRLAGNRASEYRDRHERLLDRLDLADRADSTVNDLSRGMKQKVSLAAVLAREPAVVFLDEPTLGLDVESSRELRSELLRLADEEEITVILSSHDMDVIETLCDRVIILDNGRVIRDGAVSEMIDGFRTEQVELVAECPDPARIESVLRSRFTVSRLTATDDRVRCELTLPSGNALSAVIDAVADRDGEVIEVETIAPDFETAFLEITSDEESDHTALTETDD